MIQRLLDPKAIVSFLGIVLLFYFLFLLLNELEDTSLGENEYSKKSLEQGKESLSILSNGYFLAFSIVGTLSLIFTIVLIYKKYFE